ncbi:MAG: MATE family efflux transporter [Granulosicoccus sp.]|nr:MATE family efflux transporter [Granulosicoccus sp.]
MTETSKLTEGSIVGHLIRLSIPASMGMIFNTLYNLTDFWFAGLLSDQALAGMAIAGSVFFMLLAVGIGIQTGTSAVIAPEVGRDEMQDVGEWLDQSFGLSILFSFVTMCLGWLLADKLIVFLGAEPDIAPLAGRYLDITLAGSIGFVLSFAAAGALMALGDTVSNRNALVVGFFANFILNPVLTFGLNMGVAGLALATVVIKFATAFYLLSVLYKKIGRWSRPRFSWSRWWTLLKQVLPASANMLTIILGGFISVALIGRFGSQHVAGYSVGLRLEQVLLLPALGLNTAVMAIAGQNFGAGNAARVYETYNKGLMIGLVMAAVSIPVMVFLSPLLVGFFTNSQEIQDTGAAYLRIDAIAFYAYVVLFLSVALLQALQQPMFPMVLGVCRQLLLPATINYLLIVVWGFPMLSIFYTIVTVVILSAVVANLYTRRQIRKLMLIESQ